MARNRAQAGAKAAAEARKRMAKTVLPGERALAAWIEAVAAEHAAHVVAVTNLAKLADIGRSDRPGLSDRQRLAKATLAPNRASYSASPRAA